MLNHNAEFAEYTSAQERIALGKRSRKREAAKKRDEMRDLINEACVAAHCPTFYLTLFGRAEEDEETKEWEQEQLRRGGHGTPEPDKAEKIKPTYKPAPSASMSSETQNILLTTLQVPAMIQIPTLGPAIGRLTQQLTKLRTSHANNTASVTGLAKKREEADEKEKEMRVMVERAEEKRAWFSEFRDWIEGVANFFDVKVRAVAHAHIIADRRTLSRYQFPLLEKLEDEHVSLLQERSDMIEKRRRADDEDDLSTLFGPLSDSDNVRATPNEINNVAPPPLSKRERHVARIARRQLRQQRRTTDEEDGYSTDSSLPPSDATAYDDALKSLASKKKDILSDVKVKEFHSPEKVRWNAWREKYSDSYVSAWGGLGMISVWEFWARLELLGWDCIEVSPTIFLINTVLIQV